MMYSKAYQINREVKITCHNFKMLVSSFLAIILIVILCPINNVFAEENEDETGSIQRNCIYVTDDPSSIKEARNEGFSISASSSISEYDIMNTDYLIVNFDELYSNEDFAKAVAKFIQCGKKIFLRASGYSANRTIISHVLGIDDTAGYIQECTEKEVKNREGTFGFIVFVDATGNLQIVRQLVVLSDEINNEISISKNSHTMICEQSDDLRLLKNSDTKNLHINVFRELNFDLPDEIEAINSFFEEISPIDIGRPYQDDHNDLTVQSVFTDYAYDIIYDTQYYYLTVHTSANSTAYIKIGAITRALYAERFYCASSNWGNPNIITSKWGYMTDVWMQPKWNQSTLYRSLNEELSVRFYTFPSGPSNATYLMKFRDYTPTVSVSGSTDVTLSLSANAGYDDGFVVSGSGGFSATTSYKDVVIEVPYWQTGLGMDYNVAGWKYTISPTSNRYTTNPVSISTIKLPSGVVLWNYGTKYSCIQLNFWARWKINQGLLSTISLEVNGGLVWQPANLY